MFINTVFHYLMRYNPLVVRLDDSYICMSFVYEYKFAVEIFLKDDSYKIRVMVMDKDFLPARSQKLCEKLSKGIKKNINSRLARIASRNVL